MRWLHNLLNDPVDPLGIAGEKPTSSAAASSSGPDAPMPAEPQESTRREEVSPSGEARRTTVFDVKLAEETVAEKKPLSGNSAARESTSHATTNESLSQGNSAGSDELLTAIETLFGMLAQRSREAAARQAELLEKLDRRLEQAVALPAAAAANSSEVSTADALAPHLTSLQAGQQQLLTLVETRLRSDEALGKAQERLFDELNGYKANFVRQQLQPILKEVIDCHDFVAKELQRPGGETGESGSVGGARFLEALRQMLLDLLFKYDVEPYRGESAVFDPRWQQCVKTIPTDDAARDKNVAESGLTGFKSGDLPLRREQVTVFKYRGESV